MSADSNTQKQSYPPARVAGLKPFRSGESGNPGGYPRGVPKVSHAYARLLKLSPAELEAFEPSNTAENIALQRVRKAIGCKKDKGLASAKEVTDRTEGKTPERIEIFTDNRTQIEVLVTQLSERYLKPADEIRRDLIKLRPEMGEYLELEADEPAT